MQFNSKLGEQVHFPKSQFPGKCENFMWRYIVKYFLSLEFMLLANTAILPDAALLPPSLIHKEKKSYVQENT
jgi:hypothetical protein